MTTATASADLSVIRARQQKTWASGDHAVVASRILHASELRADLITPGDPGHDEAPQSLSQRC